MTVLEVALSEREVAAAQRKARDLQKCVVGTSPRAKVEVDAATLIEVLRFVGAARPKPGAQPVRPEARAGSGAVRQSVEAIDDEISPQEAASILRMSRPSVMRLIAKGHLHPRKVLSRNKLSRAEVIAFQNRNTRRQHQALEALSAMSEEYDF